MGWSCLFGDFVIVGWVGWFCCLGGGLVDCVWLMSLLVGVGGCLDELVDSWFGFIVWFC